MKLALYPETPVGSIPIETNGIHLVRPVELKKLEKVLGKCPQCRDVSMSKSCFKRLPHKSRKLFEKYGIRVEVESKRGRAIAVPLEKMVKVIELRKDYQSLREIERLTDVPKSTVHYLVNYAHRDKIKKGDTTIYLK
ncbi:MAG: hypothetical protein CL943_03185 [Candidatus Diapherotrites archaeon]|uniref:Uncharacterized protein n=1 Tax=Candidatus Iainarchaeum sp. TaxID=3101447 RepID=A0A2D6M1J1_9ARCH|nr:hypothetical protein [Candidatus Diapherotrites archaeon]|tara:strand:- start:2186 stop:2596 length:411 start_codon:yes stop_codon:yes gene_type:complete